jgi:hypothetical protein
VKIEARPSPPFGNRPGDYHAPRRNFHHVCACADLGADPCVGWQAIARLRCT